jgi:hypothetical protein
MVKIVALDWDYGTWVHAGRRPFFFHLRCSASLAWDAILRSDLGLGFTLRRQPQIVLFGLPPSGLSRLVELGAFWVQRRSDPIPGCLRPSKSCHGLRQPLRSLFNGQQQITQLEFTDPLFGHYPTLDAQKFIPYGHSAPGVRAAASPARPALWWPRGLIDDLAQDLRPNAAFAARARLILQCPEPTSDISPPPLRDLVMVHDADLLYDTPIPWAANCTIRPLCAKPCGVLWARSNCRSCSFSADSIRAFHAAWTSKHPSTFFSDCHY